MASGSSWEYLRAHAAERRVPPRAVEARIFNRCVVLRPREPPKVGRQALPNRKPREALRGDVPVRRVHPIRAAHRPACRARSQTRQPLLRIRTTREPVARQLPQQRNTGSGSGETWISPDV